MKQIILLRHAEAEISSSNIPDFDREITENGIKSLNNLACLFIENNIKPDLIITSSANRTFITAKIIAKKLSIAEEKIIENRNIYKNDFESNIDILLSVDDKISSVMFVGHNPAISQMASYFSKEMCGLKTASSIAFNFDIDSWADLFIGNAKLVFSII